MQNEDHTLREAARALRDDLLMRAEMNKHLHAGDIVVGVSNGVWKRFNAAIRTIRASFRLEHYRRARAALRAHEHLKGDGR